jgi:hypothetical protein
MNENKEKTFTCKKCDTVDSWLNEFPNGLCVECHDVATRHIVWTAADIRKAFGGK